MKRLLIGYDGSPAASAAMEDFVHACIPPPVEALVLSVADVWLPPEQPATGVGGPGTFARPDADLYVKARIALDNSRTVAEEGAHRLVQLFPDWRVTSDAMADSPGWGLVERARAWKADLVVVGAHSHTTLERFFFGSAAATAVMQAPCSVRISRPRKHPHHRALRIVLAMDGSPDSEQAVRETASRTWPPETEFRVLAVLDPKLETDLARSGRLAQPWLAEHFQGTKERISAITMQFTEKLRMRGRTAEPHIFEGDPKKVLLHEAEGWRADCIFLGARGLNHGGRWLLGSVASAVASRAHCSVEIVRPS